MFAAFKGRCDHCGHDHSEDTRPAPSPASEGEVAIPSIHNGKLTTKERDDLAETVRDVVWEESGRKIGVGLVIGRRVVEAVIAEYLSGRMGISDHLRGYLETIKDTPAGEHYDRNEDHKFTCASCECMKALAEAALSTSLPAARGVVSEEAIERSAAAIHHGGPTTVIPWEQLVAHQGEFFKEHIAMCRRHARAALSQGGGGEAKCAECSGSGSVLDGAWQIGEEQLVKCRTCGGTGRPLPKPPAQADGGEKP